MLVMTGVSAVIPVHNGAAYVGDAIRSVLAQTHPAIECLVIDDGSTDETAEVVGGFGSAVTYVRQDQGGPAKARNLGNGIARGEFVAFLDHDDVWFPGKLEAQLEALRGRPEATLLLCAAEVVDARGATLEIKRPRSYAPEAFIEGLLTFRGAEMLGLNSGALMRRDWLVSVGGYDPVLSTSADWDLLIRALFDGGVAYIDQPLVRYRLHGSNLHRNVALMERDMRYAFAKAFADPRIPAAVRSRRRHAYGRLHRMLAGSYRDVGDRSAMVRSLATSVRYDPRVALELVPLLRGRLHRG
jgi:glycosyltransferase involved in cell wall biosynthesis